MRSAASKDGSGYRPAAMSRTRLTTGWVSEMGAPTGGSSRGCAARCSVCAVAAARSEVDDGALESVPMRWVDAEVFGRDRHSAGSRGRVYRSGEFQSPGRMVCGWRHGLPGEQRVEDVTQQRRVVAAFLDGWHLLPDFRFLFIPWCRCDAPVVVTVAVEVRQFDGGLLRVDADGTGLVWRDGARNDLGYCAGGEDDRRR